MLRIMQIALVATLGVLIATILVTADFSDKNASMTANTPSKEGAASNMAETSSSGGNAEPSKMPRPEVPVTAQTEVAARNVGSGLVAVPVVAGEPLQRIEALPQPTPPPAPKLPEPVNLKNHMRWKLVYNSVISSAGVFDLNGTSLVLPDIDVVSVDENCTAPDGATWPCGMVARTAFRNFVKGKAITCKVPDVPPQDAYIADCRLQGRDMAEWLVEQGWARAKPSTSYVEKETAAKSYRRGIYGNPPAGVEALRQPAVRNDVIRNISNGENVSSSPSGNP